MCAKTFIVSSLPKNYVLLWVDYQVSAAANGFHWKMSPRRREKVLITVEMCVAFRPLNFRLINIVFPTSALAWIYFHYFGCQWASETKLIETTTTAAAATTTTITTTTITTTTCWKWKKVTPLAWSQSCNDNSWQLTFEDLGIWLTEKERSSWAVFGKAIAYATRGPGFECSH